MSRATALIVAMAIIWTAGIFASAAVLYGTSCRDAMLPILAGVAAASGLILGATLPGGDDNG